MPRDRRKQYRKMIEREQEQKNEKMLERKNAYGICDETPFLAVNRIINGKQNG